MAVTTATEELRAEHESIEVMLDVLDAVAERADRGQQLNDADLSHMVEFLRVFADRCHHAKEERALIPEMEDAGIPREGGLIATILSEHVTARGYVRGLAEAVEALDIGDQGAIAAIASNAHAYVTLLRDHIEKENDIFFPMADQHLRPEQQSRLISAFDRIEEERIGHGKHEELHDLLLELREAYLGAGAGAAMR
ncbi:MAG: hemerythrin domain-containing protein [Anaerolineae bacterium]